MNAEQLAFIQTVLTHWDIPPVQSIETLGGKDTVFKVATVGETFVLKDIWNAPDLDRLAFTHALLEHITRAGLQVPLPYLTRSAQFVVPVDTHFYLLTKFIEASEYPRDPALMPELFYHTGQTIARLHQALASYPDKEADQKTWREDPAGRVPGWMATLGEGFPAPQAAVIERALRERGAAMEAAMSGLPEQLIHRDCHPGNVLVQGTRVVGFIDCDHICIGPRFFDLSYYVLHHLKWMTEDKAATGHWLTSLPYFLSGYNSQQALSPEEVTALPYGMMAYHLMLAHWSLKLSNLESVALEVCALDWIHRNFDAIAQAIAS